MISCFCSVATVCWFLTSVSISSAESDEQMLASVTSVTNLSPERHPVKMGNTDVVCRAADIHHSLLGGKIQSSLENNSPSHLRSNVLILL